MRRVALLLAAAALVGGCVRETGGVRSVVRRRRGAVGTVTSTGRRGLAVIAEGGETGREAAQALAAPLAAECSAEALGVRSSIKECLAAARERGVERLLACRVVEYDPYDPARLVVSLSVDEVAGASRLSARQAMTLGRGPGAAARPEARRHLFEKTVSIDLRSGTSPWGAAYARELGLGSAPEDLLEAEILLRDPARFFPFAARRIAGQLPPRLAPAAPVPPGEQRIRPSASVSRPTSGSRALGALDDLR